MGVMWKQARRALQSTRYQPTLSIILFYSHYLFANSLQREIKDNSIVIHYQYCAARGECGNKEARRALQSTRHQT